MPGVSGMLALSSDGRFAVWRPRRAWYDDWANVPVLLKGRLPDPVSWSGCVVEYRLAEEGPERLWPVVTHVVYEQQPRVRDQGRRPLAPVEGDERVIQPVDDEGGNPQFAQRVSA